MSKSTRQRTRTLFDVAALITGADTTDACDQQQRMLQLTSLEDRLLFSATPVSPEMVEGEPPAEVDEQPVNATEGDADQALQQDDLAGSAALDTVGSLHPVVQSDQVDGMGDEFILQWDANQPSDASGLSAIRRELVIVDTSTQDYQTLLDDLLASADDDRQFEVLLLDGSRDGVEQISDALSSYSELDALHLLTHGTEGRLRLGNSWLDANGLDGYAGEVAGWNDALRDGADLMIYGCNLAATADGQSLIESLAALCNCDVAASTDATGHASLGGDWELEFAVGVVETEVAFSVQVQQDWSGLLAIYTVTNTNDSGAGSLRQAILDANDNLGQDSIEFALTTGDSGYVDPTPGAPGSGDEYWTIALTTALPTITDSIILDGTTQAGFAGTPVIELDGSSVGGDGFEIGVGGDNSTIRGFVIHSFDDAGIWIHDANGVTIEGNYIGTDVTGTLDFGNLQDGISIQNSDNNQIGGTTLAQRNVISGNNESGIFVNSFSTGNQIQGNFIGTDASGTAAVGNTLDGIWINGSNNTVGGAAAGAGNVISGNLDEGLSIDNGGTGNIIQGNFIGTDASATLNLGNAGEGVLILDGAANVVGGTGSNEGNTIAYSGGVGVAVDFGNQNSIRGNAIFGNGGLGIDLARDGVTSNDLGDPDGGPNRRQNFPVLDAAQTSGTSITITGSLNSRSDTDFELDFFASGAADGSGHGEAERYLGSATVTTDGSGNAVINSTLTASVTIGEWITATATDSSGKTSEFSFALQASGAVLAVNDSYNMDEDSVLNIAGPGVLGNDSSSDALPTAGYSLNYDVDQDVDGDNVLQDTTGTGGFDWNLDPGITVTNTPTTSLPEIDTALLFDGSGGGTMQSLQNLSGDPSDNSASFEIWFNPTDANGIETVFEGGGTGGGISLVLHDWFIEFTVFDGGTSGFVSADISSEIADNELIQVVGVVDMDSPTPDMHLYVNGSLVASDINISGLTTWTKSGASGLGATNGGIASFDSPTNLQGEIALFRFYESTLSGADVKSNYDAITTSSDLTVSSVNTTGTVGSVAMNADGSFSYTPTPGWSGIDTFEYTADNGITTDTATVTVNVSPVNDAPTVSLANLVNSVGEDTDTSSAIKVADIVITDDALGTNDLSLSGADAASFEIVGTELRLKAGTSLDFETQTSYDVTVEVDDLGVGGTPDDTVAHSLSIADANDAPTIALANVVSLLGENTDTSSAIKIADIVITDDALGTNNLTLTGVDAASFEIVGTELRLRAGTSLDFETQASFDVTVEVDDLAVGGTPDATTAHTLSLTDVNEAPTITLTNVVTLMSENTDTSSAIKIADILITDDALGTNNLTLTGVDAASFEIVGAELRLRAGTTLDFETQANFDVTVEVDDLAVGGTPDATTAHSLSITDANEAPTVSLTNVVPSLAEDTDTSSAIKIADIVITDDALGANNLTLAGADAASFEIVGTELRLRAGTALDFETQASYDVTVEVDDLAVGGSPDATTVHSLSITDSNESPTVSLTNVVPSLGEDTDTSSAIKIADIVITDDALGTNSLSLSGADAASFEIVGTELRLRAGTALDFESQASYDVTVEVDDLAVGGTPDATAAHSLSITDANEVPTVSLTNVVASLAEDTDTSSPIKVADIVITDDALGSNDLTLSGADAASFEIVGTELRLRAGTSLDFETQASYDVTVEVDDLAVGGTPDDTASHSLSITDTNEVPTVSLTNVVVSLAEDTDTSSAIKIADIVITDDALGTNNLTLTGVDAASFEIVGTELRLRAGTALDFETQASFDVTVEVDDLAVVGTPDATTAHSLSITDANDAPTVALTNVVPSLAEDTDTSSAIKVADIVITDDAFGTNSLSLSGADAARFEIVGTELRLRAGTALDFETQASYDVTVEVDDLAVSGTPDDTVTHSLSITDTNEAPTVALTNVVPSLAEDTDTSTAIKIADIVITDDALGTNNLTLSGADAASFEIVGTELRLRAGTTLDFETQASYGVTVEVDDVAVSGTPDATAAHSLSITDANEAPTVSLTNVVPSLAEDTDTSSAIKIADIVITDDALGTNSLTLTGVDAARFEIVGTELRLRSGTALDFETQASYDVTVEVDDLAVSGTPDDTVTHSLSITDTNEAPTVALTNVVPSLAEDTDTSSAIKIADIVITDDALGTNNLTLSGADAASFEIVGTELRLRAGTALDFESQASYDVTVEVDDVAVSGTPDDTVTHSLSITDTNEAPTVALTNVVPSLAEDTDTSSAIKIADIVITDDALGTNNLTLSGADAASFEIVGTELRLRAGTVLDFTTQASYDVTVEVDDLAVGGTPDATTAHSLSITDANGAPTVALTNVAASLAENTDTSSAIKIADIVITDDALGTNSLSLSGADAARFEIVGTELRLRAGTALDFETQASFDVIVDVDDLAVGGSPDDSAAHSLLITDANDAPTVTLTNVVPSLNENADTSGAIRIADIAIADDALGTNDLTLAGADASRFEIVGTELRLRAGAALDFETQPALNVIVRVDDSSIGGSPDSSASHTLSIANANDAPVAGDDALTAIQGETMLLSAASLLANDTDIDLDSLQVLAITQPAHGMITLSASGTLTYTPDSDFFGVDSFAYTVADSSGATDTATVTVAVDPMGAVLPVTTTDVTDPVVEVDDESEEDEVDTTIELIPQQYQSDRSDNIRPLRLRVPSSSDLSVADSPIALLVSPRSTTHNLVATTAFFQRSDVIAHVSDIHTVLHSQLRNLAYIYSEGGFLSDLNSSTSEIYFEYPIHQWVAGSAVFASAGLSVGYVMWTIRGGYLLASMLSSIPAWAFVDPLPVLEYLDDSEQSKSGKDRGDDESLDSIIDEAINLRSSDQDQNVEVYAS